MTAFGLACYGNNGVSFRLADKPCCDKVLAGVGNNLYKGAVVIPLVTAERMLTRSKFGGRAPCLVYYVTWHGVQTQVDDVDYAVVVILTADI